MYQDRVPTSAETWVHHRFLLCRLMTWFHRGNLFAKMSLLNHFLYHFPTYSLFTYLLSHPLYTICIICPYNILVTQFTLPSFSDVSNNSLFPNTPPPLPPHAHALFFFSLPPRQALNFLPSLEPPSFLKSLKRGSPTNLQPLGIHSFIIWFAGQTKGKLVSFITQTEQTKFNEPHFSSGKRLGDNLNSCTDTLLHSYTSMILFSFFFFFFLLA